jgi:ABC-type bacteriocin/lantibiotic exporter with double-glycine peptidase domain
MLGYVLRLTGRHQLGLAVLSIAVFALSAVPLELQRRIVNGVVDKGPFQTILLLAAGYAGVALTEQSLKVGLNIYRGWVAESSVRDLRQRMRRTLSLLAGTPQSTADAGVEISLMIDESEPVGGFVGVSLSEPLLQIGTLINVIVYMLVLETQLALIGLAFFLPQLIFVPLMQGAINRRAEQRILVKRQISEAIVESVPADSHGWSLAEQPIQQVFTLNMGIYKIKYSMNLLMNLLHHLSVAAALLVGGWLALQGRFEIGTVVAIVGGLGKLNDPWGDLVNWGREFSVVGVKYRLFADAAVRLTRQQPAENAQPMQVST